MDLVLAHKAI